ncbi:MAG: MATE family efflux transporter, partial [Pseudomonadota bacterium]
AACFGVVLIMLANLIDNAGRLFMQPSEDMAKASSEYQRIRQLSSPFALAGFVILGIFIGLGRAMLGLALQLLMNGTNIVLSIYFGFYLELDVTGVAWGTVVAEVFAAVVGFYIVFLIFRGWPSPSLDTVWAKRSLYKLFRLNRNLMMRSAMLLSVFAFFVRAGTELGPVVLAANAILFRFYLMISYFFDGLTAAAEHICGRSIGSRDSVALANGVRLTMFWSFVLAIILSVSFYFLGNDFAKIITQEKDILHQVDLHLPWAAATALSGFLSFQMDGIFAGATWSRGMRDTMCVSFVAFLIALLIFVPKAGNSGLWASFNAFLFMRGLAMCVVYKIKMRELFF